MNQPFIAITQLLEQYFDGLYFGDLERLQNVFHPEAHYITAVSGTLEQLNMERYFQRVANRPSPASLKQKRHDKVLSIELVGTVTALAKVQCVIAPKHFTDVLNLVCIDGKWQVISKVFHYQLIEE